MIQRRPGTQINSLIFNDARNLNQEVSHLYDVGISYKSMVLWRDSLNHLKEILSKRELPKSRLKKYRNPDDDVFGGYDDYDLLKDEWGNGIKQLMFVPSNSLLFKALMLYYAHIDEINGRTINIKRDIIKYAHGLTGRGYNGFYYDTGLDYDTHDELFAGIRVKNKQSPDDIGSGIPSKQFLDYLNNDKC